MSQVKLSVCISVHNTAEFLPRCLESVVNQTLKSLEIVLVNNGSTDNSEDIMRQYQAKYDERKIVIISQEDLGLAQGRQSGINNASGEYITFLDADDYVMTNAYEKMVNYADEKNVDIVEADTIRGDNRLSAPVSGIQNTHDVLSAYFLGEVMFHPMLWMRIYKRSLLSKKVLPELYVNNEDIFAYPCILFEAGTIGYIKEVLHVYSLDNENAIMIELAKKRELAKKYYNNRKKILKALPHIESFIGERQINSMMPREFMQYKQRLIMQFLNSDIYGVSFEDKINDIKKELSFKDSQEVIKFLEASAVANTKANVGIRLFGIKKYYHIRRLIKSTLAIVKKS